jgi:hypothetical protein
VRRVDVEVDGPAEVIVAWRADETSLVDGVLTLPSESAAVVGPASG